MTDAQTEARAIVSATLPPHEQAILGHDAVTVLTDLIATALAAKDAELAQVIKTGFERCADISARAERAEAQLAETRKALEIADAFFRCIRFDRDRDTFAAEAVDTIRAALRVLEGGKSDE